MKILQISYNPKRPIFEDGADFIGINNFHISLPEEIKPVGWLQVHRPEDMSNEDPSHLEWLYEEHDFPIYMNERNIELGIYPSAVALPVEELKKLWVYDDLPSFASSFDWAIALGIYLGYEKIVMHNVNFISTREAYIEAPGLMLWRGLAHIHGVEFEMISRLWTKYNYGFESRHLYSWMPYELACDIIVDYVNRGSREWRKAYNTLSANAYMFAGYGIDRVSKESAREFNEMIDKIRQEESDEVDSD